MKKWHFSMKKAMALSTVLFLIGLAILSYLNAWWPGIALVIGIPLALRQYLLGKIYDMVITLIIFVGVFLIVLLHLSERYLLPVIFILGGIYIFFRDFIESKTPSEDEREEDLNEEIEEEQQEKKK